MATFFADKPVSLRPHAKTHKCPQIALRQLDAGAIGITCAKLGEAEVLVEAGVRDILIANQVIGPIKCDRLTDLAHVVADITTNTFWILTHPQTHDRAYARFHDLQAGRNPSDPYAGLGPS